MVNNHNASLKIIDYHMLKLEADCDKKLSFQITLPVVSYVSHKLTLNSLKE